MEKENNEALSREVLDLERTKMSLERTYLSFIRTSLTILVAGVSLIQFFENNTFRTIGFLLIPCSVLILLIGTIRLFNKRKKLREMADRLAERK